MKKRKTQAEHRLPNPAPTQDTVRPVMRSVVNDVLIHVYLACGHMLTYSKTKFVGELPSAIECWACCLVGNSEKTKQ